MLKDLSSRSRPLMGFLWISATLLLIPTPAVLAATLDPAIGARIAALTNEGEGTPVTEEMMRRGDKPGSEMQRTLTRAAAAAEPFLDESVRQADWNETHMGIDGPACFDAAPKLALMFRAKDLPGYVAARATHVFMFVETPEAVLLIDPTIRQYFGQDSAPSWVPKIFVGTLSELQALYDREPGLPVLPYQKIYFDSEWPASRSDSMMLSRRSRFLTSPASAEHAPLSDYFNINGVSLR